MSKEFEAQIKGFSTLAQLIRGRTYKKLTRLTFHRIKVTDRRKTLLSEKESPRYQLPKIEQVESLSKTKKKKLNIIARTVTIEMEDIKAQFRCPIDFKHNCKSKDVGAQIMWLPV
jgi:hypothetical protein